MGLLVIGPHPPIAVTRAANDVPAHEQIVGTGAGEEIVDIRRDVDAVHHRIANHVVFDQSVRGLNPNVARVVVVDRVVTG